MSMNKLIHGPNIAGQSLADRVSAAKFSIAGQGLAKSVAKATTEEVLGPKKKHLDYLLKCTNEPNVSIPQLANLLIERTQNGNWVVVYKSLVSIHNLQNYGNERFSQYLASNNCTFNLDQFLDKAGVQGYDMSTYIRRYAKYLNEKSVTYRMMAFDFCKVKRGKDDGLLRKMNTEKLLKALPILQNQVDALLEFDVSPNELTNGVINACFMLLFKDLIRLFACYNDGIINLLEKYFEMTKKQCREALDLYKRFLVRMDRTSEFLKVCESVGIEKGDIPDLAKAPSSLLEALEEHLKSLESAKKSGQPAPKVAAKITSEISTFAAAATSGVNAAVISDEEKRRIIEEEAKQLEQIKEQSLKDSPTDLPDASVTNPFSSSGPPSQVGVNLFGAGSPSHNASHPNEHDPARPSDDLLNMAGSVANPFAATSTVPSNNPFASAAASAAPAAAPSASPWGSPSIPVQAHQAAAPVHSFPTQPSPQPPVQNGTTFATDAAFDRAFGNKPASVVGAQSFGLLEPLHPASSNSDPSGAQTGFDGFGDILQPSNQPPHSGHNAKLIQGDLDSSLASLAGNLNINPSQQVKKTEHQWTMGASGGKMTGSSTTQQWATQTQSTASYNQPMAMGAPAMGGMPPPMAAQPGFQQPGMINRFPVQPAMGGIAPRPMGMMAPSQPAPLMYGQPAATFPAQQQPTTNDPFGAL